MFSAALKSGAAATPSDPDFEYVTMLLHGDGTNGAQNNTFLDSSTNNFTITRNGNTTQGSFSPYGPNWSNYFNGSSTIVTPTSTALSFGTGDFSIEAWINYTAGSWIISNYTQLASPGDYGTLIGWNGGNIQGRLKSDNANEFILTSSVQATAQTWNHVAFVRTGTTVSLYLNGVRVATGTSSISSVTNQFRVGGTYVNSSTADFTGYVSNLRVCKGTTPYLASATSISVSTQPLTVVSGTSLLTCADNRFIDDSTNNFAITATGTPSVQRFSPFAPTAAYNPATIGGSGYFDGAGDFLTVPDSTQTDLGSGDFTVECWFYQFSAKVASCISLSGALSGNGYAFGASGTAGKLWWYATSAQIVQSNTFAYNAWNHAAVVRSGGTTTMYVNGVSVGSFSDSKNYSGGLTYIGSDEVGTQDWNGYIAGARIVKGTAVYTSNFTPPTAPPSAVTNTQLLTNFTNGAIFDNAMMNDLETVGNAQISTSVSRFGTGSMYFAGGVDFLKSSPSAVYGLGSGNFTIEMWYYPIASSGPFPRIFEITQDPNGAFVAGSWGLMDRGLASPNYGFFAYNINSSGSIVFSSSASVVNGAWVHLALVRNGTSITLYINGVNNGSTTSSASLNTGSSYVWVGGTATADASSNSYIDEFRITNGVARYTANFTPPTAAFPDR